MNATVTHIEGREGSDAERRRIAWGRNLTDAMAANGLSVKALHRELLEAGLDVSTQSIYGWRNGSNAPTPEKQTLVAQVLRMPVHLLFPVAVAA